MLDEDFKIIKLRQAISAVIFKDNKFLMVSGRDWPKGAWCFPQGGIKAGETHLEAVKRELKEELGTDKFEVLGKSQIDHTYIFPNDIKEKKGCEGQYQTIWFVQFLGGLDEIKPNEKELMQQLWFDRDEILNNMMYPEQKETFEKVLGELDKLRENKIY